MKQLCFATAVLLLTACAQPQGVKLDAAQLSALTVGKTSIADVEAQYGVPTSITISNDGATTTTLGYTYIPPSSADALPFVESVAKNDNDRKQTVSLVFYNGLFKSYSQTIAPSTLPATPTPARAFSN